MWSIDRSRRRFIMYASSLAASAVVLATGCNERSNGTDSTPAEPLGIEVTTDTFEPQYDLIGDPLPGRVDDVISIDSRLGITASVNRIYSLTLSNDKPPRVIEGREVFKGDVSSTSRPLQVTEFVEPVGSRIVQVDVNLDSPLALRKVSGNERDLFVPSPVLQDTIRNTYWPSGYILRTDAPERADVTTEILIKRGEPIKDLNDLPRLSRNKPQRLTLLYFVNKGVTIESFSYGGEAPKFTFTLEIPDQ